MSIKSLERRSRGKSNKIVESGNVKIPQDFQKFLNNGENKERLFELIEEIWIRNRERMDMGRTVYFARGERCLKLTQNEVTEIEVLQTDHEEADSKITYLSQHAATVNDSNEICVRSSSGDIDIPVILTGTLGGIETRLFVDNGTGKSRKTILINNSIFSVQQQQALIGFHAFTDNDYVSSFLHKTKKLWQTLVRDDEEMLEFFVALGSLQRICT